MKVTPVNAWTVTCDNCRHGWTLAGTWSEYERQAIESRPCPRCGAYTLSSPEPKPVRGKGRRAFHAPVRMTCRAAG